MNAQELMIEKWRPILGVCASAAAGLPIAAHFFIRLKASSSVSYRCYRTRTPRVPRISRHRYLFVIGSARCRDPFWPGTHAERPGGLQKESSPTRASDNGNVVISPWPR
jgi:hypothetical protein